MILPADANLERLILGALITDPDAMRMAKNTIAREDFTVEKHRTLFAAMGSLVDAGSTPDRVTVAMRLKQDGKLDSVDGVGYIVSLDEGLPQILNLDSYISSLLELSARRRLIFACQSAINALMVDSANRMEILGRIQSVAGAVELNGNGSGLMDLSGTVAADPSGLSGFLEPHRSKPIPTPWSGMTELLAGGWRKQELVILAARPGLGKSAAAGQIALAAAESGCHVGVFSLEMARNEIWLRLCSAVGRVALQRFRRGYCNRDERDAIQGAVRHLADTTTLRVSDVPHRTISALERALRAERSRGKMGLAIIDYVQLLQLTKRARSRIEEMTEISRTLKLLAKELEIPIVAVAQLNRDSIKEDREPRMEDLRETGALEQDADIIILIHQKSTDRAKSIESGEPCPTMLSVVKQRNGPVGKVPCVFNARFVMLEEKAQ